MTPWLVRSSSVADFLTSVKCFGALALSHSQNFAPRSSVTSLIIFCHNPCRFSSTLLLAILHIQNDISSSFVLPLNSRSKTPPGSGLLTKELICLLVYDCAGGFV